MLTHNVATMTRFAYERIHVGLSMPGLFEVSRRVPGGSQKLCTVDHLIQFVNDLYPDNYEVVLRLNKVKQMLDAQLPRQKAA